MCVCACVCQRDPKRKVTVELVVMKNDWYYTLARAPELKPHHWVKFGLILRSSKRISCG